MVDSIEQPATSAKKISCTHTQLLGWEGNDIEVK